MFFPAEFDMGTNFKVYAQVSQTAWILETSKKPTRLTKDFMWNHFAFVVASKYNLKEFYVILNRLLYL